MTSLELKVQEAQNAYYNGTPIMNDIEFDALWDQLKKEQPESELLQEVGADHSDGFSKRKHQMIMGSQNKANTEDDMNDYFSKNKGEQIVGYKMDGISIEMAYVNGKFTFATTRGDGKIGDDITENVSKMNGVVKQLKADFTGPIRGEILLKKSVLAEKYPEAANCRNQASGISKRKDGSGCENLNVVVYDARNLDGTSFGTVENQMKFLEGEGFEVAPWFKAKMTGAEAIAKINEVFANRNAYDYDIDGLVFKTNEIDMDDLNNNYRPTTQIALKPARTLVTTKITGFCWEQHNGTFTPVVLIEPRDILGATVKRASLANLRMIENLGLEIGHEVTICRCGEIIPKLIKDNVTGKFVEGYCD